MKPLILIALLWLTGCALVPAHPGDINLTESKVDNQKELAMEPAFCDEHRLRLGFRKSSRMKPDQVVVTALLPYVAGIQSGESLVFNVDGEKIALKTEQTFTNFDNTYSGQSSKDYVASMDLVKKIQNAKRVGFQVSLMNNKYDEDTCNTDEAFSMKRNLNSFVNQLDKIK